MDGELLPTLSDDEIIWRYLSFTRLIAFLSLGGLYFSRCDGFIDPFEGALGKKRHSGERCWRTRVPERDHHQGRLTAGFLHHQRRGKSDNADADGGVRHNVTSMYRVIRDLHLYFGLFVSPFVLLFAASVFYLNHGKVRPGSWAATGTCGGLAVPADLADAQGADAVESVRAVLTQCGVTGEIGFIGRQRQNHRLVIPVTRPGVETQVTIDPAARSASLRHRNMGLWETVAYLHKSPGPHNVAIRGNWFWTRAWRWFADGTVYLLLFISMTGVYLWWVLRAERRVGIALLVVGACSLFGTVYGILR